MKQQNRQVSNLPSELSAPARRALDAAGIDRLEQLTKVKEADLAQLHGIGPKALAQLRRALSAQGLAFAASGAGTASVVQAGVDPSASKKAAVSFLQLASSGKVKEAYRRYIGTSFRHHNPYFQGTAEALSAAMQENANQFPRKTIDVKRVLADGDWVAVQAHVCLQPGDPGIATIHLFRFEGDRIVELWDVGQPVLKDSPNENGMF